MGCIRGAHFVKKLFVFLTIGVIFFLLSAAIPQLSHVRAATYYVSSSGNDANDGTMGSPLQTIAGACDGGGSRPAAQAGDVFIFLPGTYSVSEEQVIDCSGASGSPIIFKSDISGTAVFDATSAGLPSDRSVVNVTGDHIVFGGNNSNEGFEVANSSGRGIGAREVDGVLIQNNVVHDIDYRGIGVNGSNIIIQDNEVYQTALMNTPLNGIGGGWPAAIQTTPQYGPKTRSTNVIIRRNDVHQNHGEGIIGWFADGVLIEDNTVYNNFSVGVYIDNTLNGIVRDNYIYTDTSNFNKQNNGRMTGISLSMEDYDDGSYPTELPPTNIEIVNNVLADVGAGFFYSNYGHSSSSFSDITFAHNTLYYSQGFLTSTDQYDEHNSTAIKLDNPKSAPSGTNQIVNNIIYDGRQGGFYGNDSNWIFSHNDWVDGIPTEASDPNSISQDPLFTDPIPNGGADGFKIDLGSPVIGDGQIVTDVTPINASADIQSDFSIDYEGATRNDPPTMGAFEQAAEPTIQFDPTIYVVNETDGTVTLDLVITGGTVPAGASVQCSTSDGTAVDPDDYTSMTQTINFSGGETTAQCTVPLIDDGDPENTEDFTVSLINESNIVVGMQGTGTVLIQDDDNPVTVEIENATYTFNEDDGTVTITLISSGGTPPDGSEVQCVSIDGTAEAGSDYTAVNEIVTFNGTDTTATCTIMLTDDIEPESDETFSIQLQGANGVNVGTQHTTVVTIQDDGDVLPSPTPTNTPMPTAIPTNIPSSTPSPISSPGVLRPSTSPIPSISSPEPSASPVPTNAPSDNSESTSDSHRDQTQGNSEETFVSAIPDLFQIDVSDTRAVIYFTPSTDGDYYFISYGIDPYDEGYSVQFSEDSDGVLSYIINNLEPNTRYCFKVRTGQGVSPGEWSNTMCVTTRGSNTVDFVSYHKGDDTSKYVTTLPRSGPMSNIPVFTATSMLGSGILFLYMGIMIAPGSGKKRYSDNYYYRQRNKKWR